MKLKTFLLVSGAAVAWLAVSAFVGPAKTLKADLGRSVVRWKGTKFAGLGKHEGTLKLSAGEVMVENGRLTDARLTIDMASLDITDIPAHETVPRKKLRDHLLHEDFFHAAKYPTATFVLTKFVPKADNLVTVSGLLTLRGKTNPVVFDAVFRALTPDKVVVDANLVIDRQKWGVAYRGSKLTNDLVDDDISLKLHLEAK
jgi:polyisoprenoid-binding protein YceI